MIKKIISFLVIMPCFSLQGADKASSVPSFTLGALTGAAAGGGVAWWMMQHERELAARSVAISAAVGGEGAKKGADNTAVGALAEVALQAAQVEKINALEARIVALERAVVRPAASVVGGGGAAVGARRRLSSSSLDEGSASHQGSGTAVKVALCGAGGGGAAAGAGVGVHIGATGGASTRDRSGTGSE